VAKAKSGAAKSCPERGVGSSPTRGIGI